MGITIARTDNVGCSMVCPSRTLCTMLELAIEYGWEPPFEITQWIEDWLPVVIPAESATLMAQALRRAIASDIFADAATAENWFGGLIKMADGHDVEISW